jgi:hypothetical protein
MSRSSPSGFGASYGQSVGDGRQQSTWHGSCARIVRRHRQPPNEAVVVAITPEKDDIAFVCGMNMLQGKVIVK